MIYEERQTHVSGSPRRSRLPIPRSSIRKSVGLPGPESLLEPQNRRPSALSRAPFSVQTSTHHKRNPKSGISLGTDVDSCTASVQLSLADRTMETLARLPASTTPKRRRSGFFDTQSTCVSPVRPHSSLLRSRPDTSIQVGSISMRMPTPVVVSPTIESPSSRWQYATNMCPDNGRVVSLDTSDKTPIKTQYRQAPLKPLIKPSHKPAVKLHEDRNTPANPLKEVSHNSTRNPLMPYDGSLECDSNSINERLRTPSKSSLTLREQIAKARSAHKTSNITGSSIAENSSHGVDCSHLEGLDIGDPLLSNSKSMSARIATARTEGRLNISALGLKQLPIEIFDLYKDTKDFRIGQASWAESVDILKLIAADNELESLDPRFFPADDLETVSSEDEESLTTGILISLEILDLHGNNLTGIPGTMGKLPYLNSLNLSRNRLGSDIFGIISLISTLQELRLTDNKLDGHNMQLILPQLRILDLSRNMIDTLSDVDCQFNQLRVLNVSHNRLRKLPNWILASSELVDVNFSHNHLEGLLFGQSPTFASRMKSIDISMNALSELLVDDLLEWPELESLKLTDNRFLKLPNVQCFSRLKILLADGNKLTTLPESLTHLEVLRTLDVSRNEIKVLNLNIGAMNSLVNFHVAGNPLRERHLLNMSTSELMQHLANRFAIPDVRAELDTSELNRRPECQKSDRWDVSLSGLLNMSNANLSTIDDDGLSQLTFEHVVKSLQLDHNKFKSIPSFACMLSMGQTLTHLDLSHNSLTGNSYILDDVFHFEKLKSLNLSANSLTSLDMLQTKLKAPGLVELRVSRNRIVSLPVLRHVYPLLTTLLVDNNRLEVLPFESVQGLQIVDVTANEISRLDPRIGTLADQGLRSLSIEANTFRVPRREIVEKGTQAILAWLRDRISDT